MPKTMIAGAGIAGSYLYRLLVRKGISPAEITIVDPGSKTRCGIAPCGYLVTRHFFALCQEVGLDANKYILNSFDVGYMGKVKFKLKGYGFSIDKPALIRDLVEGIDVVPTANGIAAERIIDATGIARAYIGRYDSDVLVPCFQMKVRFPQPLPFGEYPHHVGYSWVIPLEGSNAHVGIGSVTYDSNTMKKNVEELAQGAEMMCSCKGYVRGTGPILPLVSGNVTAIGEAGGITDPLSGGGIVPSMVSAKLLAEYWNDPEGYEAAILKEYSWFNKTSDFCHTWKEKNVFNLWNLELWKKYAEFIDFKLRIYHLMHPNFIRILLQFPRILQLLRSLKRS